MALDTVNHSSPESVAAARARQGWVCNWTGSWCPSGCGSPCEYKIDRTLSGGGVEARDFNSAAQQEG